MKKGLIVNRTVSAIFIFALTLAACSHNGDSASPSTKTSALWARTANPAGGQSVFLDVTTDASGNFYASGILRSNQSYDFGNGQTLTGKNDAYNALLVKYSPSGTTLWARTTVTAPSTHQFDASAVDASGNVYAAGYVYGTGTYEFGNGVSVSPAGEGCNAVLVKYASDGTVQWAKSIVATGASTGETASSTYNSVAVDSTGAVYTAGSIYGDWNYDFGSGSSDDVTAAGELSFNSVLVKYDAAGTVQWAVSTDTASGDTEFFDIAVDSTGNVYVAGSQFSTSAYSYGNSQTFSGAYSGSNGVVVKYASTGAAQWIKGAIAADHETKFQSLCVSGTGIVYVAGNIYGRNSANFGTLETPVSVTGIAFSNNALLVAYSGEGTAQWARVPVSGSKTSYYEDVAVSASGDVYACGAIRDVAYDFGNGITATGVASIENIFLAKFSSGGTAQSAYTGALVPDNSACSSVACTPSGGVALAGSIDGNGTYGFDSVTVTGGDDGNNAVIVRVK